MISKKEFVEYINFIKSLEDKEVKLSKSLEEIFGRENVGTIFIYNDIQPTIIKMLCQLMNVEYNADPHIGDDIQYFCSELNYGKDKYAKEAITYDDGIVVDLSTPEKLYDYLIKETADKKLYDDFIKEEEAME